MERALAEARPDAGVVVYASALKALCAAQGLIDRGVAPGRITLVRPLPAGVAVPAASAMTDVANAAAAAADRKSSLGKGGKASSPWSLGDEAVDTAAVAAAAMIGINDGGGRRLEGVRMSAEGGVAAAVFAHTETADGGGGGGRGDGSDVKEKEGRKQKRSKSLEKGGKKRALKAKGGAATAAAGGDGTPEGDDTDEDTDRENVLACDLLLCGDTPNADPDVFRAANNSGLVYDGRLVVDPSFRTSDPAVLAGGTLTKFSRVHGACAPRHEKFNAREVSSRSAGLPCDGCGAMTNVVHLPVSFFSLSLVHVVVAAFVFLNPSPAPSDVDL